MGVEAVIREDDRGPSLAALLTADPRLEIHPVDVPAGDRPEIGHALLPVPIPEPVPDGRRERLGHLIHISQEGGVGGGGGVRIIDPAAAYLSERPDQRLFDERVLTRRGTFVYGSSDRVGHG